jgi:ATP-dependent DNA helicase PIF1
VSSHKSQGQSLDAVAVRLDRSFEAGQCYVALSRARTPEGMVVTGLNISMVKSDSSVQAFYDNMKLGKN